MNFTHYLLAPVVLLGTFQIALAQPPAKAAPSQDAPAKAADATKAADAETGTTVDPGEALFNQGRDALFTGEYEQAIQHLRAAVATDKSKTKTAYRLYLAKAYRYAERDKDAVGLLREILKVTPDHVEAGRMLSEIYADGKQWKEILEILEPLLEYRHDYPTYHLLAEAAYNTGDLGKAREYYREAVKLNPKSAVDHYQLGNIYLAANAFALAAQSYEQALSLGIEGSALHYKLASAHFNLRNYFGHIQVVSVKAGEPGTISEGWYLIERVPGTKETFRAAPARSAIYHVAKVDGELGNRPDIQILRANIYLSARRYPQAYEMFAKIAPTVPAEEEALFYYYFAQSAFGIGNYDRYLELLGEAIRRDKEAYGSMRVDAYVQVAEQYNQAGNLEKYIHYLKQAVKESPRTASFHLKLAGAYEEDQQLARAVIEWRMVLDLEPDHPQRTELLNKISKSRSQTP